jgi:hypothetical protein
MRLNDIGIKYITHINPIYIRTTEKIILSGGVQTSISPYTLP